MKAGITGHQNLGSDETIKWLYSVLEIAISQYKIDLGITSLALGADQLYATVLLKKHVPYTAIIPSSRYEITFTKPTDLEKYQYLLRKASSKLVMPFTEPSEIAFYEAGKKIVSNSEMLIAIWDGQPAKGLGGTGDIVKYALAIKRNILHVNPLLMTVNKI